MPVLLFCSEAETNERYTPWLLGSLLELAMARHMPFSETAER